MFLNVTPSLLLRGGKIMNRNRTMSIQNLEKFNYEETKRNVSNYFKGLEDLEW